jgi:hypothetical protein
LATPLIAIYYNSTSIATAFDKMAHHFLADEARFEDLLRHSHGTWRTTNIERPACFNAVTAARAAAIEQAADAAVAAASRRALGRLTEAVGVGGCAFDVRFCTTKQPLERQAVARQDVLHCDGVLRDKAIVDVVVPWVASQLRSGEVT